MRYRFKILPLLLLMLILHLMSCGTNTQLTDPNVNDSSDYAFGTDETFDVATWNLREFPWAGNATLDFLAQIIPQLHLDVIALQEINDQQPLLELVARLDHYSVVISQATTSYKLAYLYNTHTVHLTDCYTIFNSDSNPFPRPPHIAKFLWHGQQEVYLINNHLKAYGDNYIDESDPWDEEVRRRLACTKLDEYISTDLPDKKVILLGDMNDQIHEPREYNVFLPFIDKPEEYLFTTMNIAQNLNWQNASYPGMTSMIDHIFITNELFDAYELTGFYTRTLNIENMVGSWSTYSNSITDHRPVAARFQLISTKPDK
ncbi:MAG: endonuclease/exonuclease/phosphatase family protein [Candidatus Cloacimonetes bacterium]|nr:endonuclease/exonuclease/phosphatase family protein [Candidatus Cloacimonadota bacterium]